MKKYGPGALYKGGQFITSHRVTSLRELQHPPYWKDDSRGCWYGPEHVGYALIDGRQKLILIDSGARANSVTPEYATKNKLIVGPVHELADNQRSLAIVGVGGITNELGYMIINVKIEEIPSYAEDQVALVVPDISGLGQEVPVILRTPIIHRLCQCMKESKICDTPPEWQTAVASYEALLAMKTMIPVPGTKFPMRTPLSLTKL